ncbi:MAG: ribosomal RNA small subunit methyltransferase A [Gemmatimonadaceae bacterium]|nr:ribosomal RNA small subunit methyltransferase A [Gemmatimonadaceae bacterium]
MIRKRFGQNFLTDRGALRRIADALELLPTDTVVEIGPGRGALTDELVDRCARLEAIEIDRDLVAHLRERYRERSHVTIHEGDVLDIDVGALARGPYVLAGNVPYYVTTPIIFHSLRAPRPIRSVFLVQREVAERLVAVEGSREYGALTVNVRLVADVDVVGAVGRGAFHPRPNVDSAIVRLRPRTDAPVVGDEDALRRFVIGCFGQRRRQLPRAIRTVTGLDAVAAAGVVGAVALDPLRRPEDLSPAEFAALWAAVARALPNDRGSTARS